MSAFPLIAFHPSPRAGAVMLMVSSHVHDRRDFRAVVTGENHQRILRHPQVLQRLQQFTDNMVQLEDEVAVRTGLGSALNASCRKRWQVDGLA